MKLMVINGPNLNLLGSRETGIYGNFTLEQLETNLKKNFETDTLLEFFQSNSESEIIHVIQNTNTNKISGIVINAGAFTHTSIAIRDALLSVKIPFVEVHISNVYARENFRHHSYLSDIALAVIAGMGEYGYFAAVTFLIRRLVST